jgi:hypothetical protein
MSYLTNPYYGLRFAVFMLLNCVGNSFLQRLQVIDAVKPNGGHDIGVQVTFVLVARLEKKQSRHSLIANHNYVAVGRNYRHRVVARLAPRRSHRHKPVGRQTLKPRHLHSLQHRLSHQKSLRQSIRPRVRA